MRDSGIAQTPRHVAQMRGMPDHIGVNLRGSYVPLIASTYPCNLRIAHRSFASLVARFLKKSFKSDEQERPSHLSAFRIAQRWSPLAAIGLCYPLLRLLIRLDGGVKLEATHAFATGLPLRRYRISGSQMRGVIRIR